MKKSIKIEILMKNNKEKTEKNFELLLIILVCKTSGRHEKHRGEFSYNPVHW